MPTEFNPEELKNFAELILDYAKKLGASAAEVSIVAHTGFSVNVRKQETESLIYHRNRGMTISVYNGQKRGEASCSDLTEAVLKSSAEAAWTIAQQTDIDPYAGLADKALMAIRFPDLEIYHPWDITPEQAIVLAKTCEATALSSHPKISNSEGASISTQTSCDVYANTHGFCQPVQSTYHHLSCAVVAEENGNMQRDYDYTVSTNPEALKDVNSVGREAAARTVRRLGAKPLKTQKVPVIFAAEVARSLLGHFMNAISGAAIYRRASFLLDHLDQKIFPEFITIYEHPHLCGALGSSVFDSEGVATREQDFVKDGVLLRYVLGSYSARRLGMQTTANADGVHNLFISPGEANLKELFQHMGTGLFVTELLGQGANLITGDYSRGASGFWVERGEIAFPVEGITLAGHLKEMYHHILAVGNDVDIRGNIRTGSIWIESMMVGGQ